MFEKINNQYNYDFLIVFKNSNYNLNYFSYIPKIF
jgi:hypothetical protein